MPGTNHQVETQFLNNLTFSLREAAEDLLKHNTLKQLLLMRRDGVNDFMKKTFPKINDLEWVQVINAVLLTKISYFEVNSQFTEKQLDKLLEIAQSAYELPGNNPVNLYRITEHKYPVFARVVKDILLLKKHFLRNR